MGGTPPLGVGSATAMLDTLHQLTVGAKVGVAESRPRRVRTETRDGVDVLHILHGAQDIESLLGER